MEAGDRFAYRQRHRRLRAVHQRPAWAFCCDRGTLSWENGLRSISVARRSFLLFKACVTDCIQCGLAPDSLLKIEDHRQIVVRVDYVLKLVVGVRNVCRRSPVRLFWPPRAVACAPDPLSA